MLDDYLDFLRRKEVAVSPRGLADVPPLNAAMFPFQRGVAEFLLRIGSGAAFLDTGLGKSIVELEFGRVVAEHTGRPVLMFAPLAVGPQHVREARKFGIANVQQVRAQDEITAGVNITNYERLHLFRPEGLGGLVLDESSIIKGFTGKTTRALMAFAEKIPFRLAATATPAPNDHMELGQHSQFLGVMESNEMLARWFIADQSEMGRYRLKRHGIRPFWAWVASWARMASSPSDLGDDETHMDLPRMAVHLHTVDTDITQHADGRLFRIPDTSATAIHREKRITAPDRAACVADLVRNDPNETWVIWCETDYEADALMARIPDAVEVRGSMPADVKEQRLVDFSDGRLRVLVTKPSIAGFGLNWQHCARCAFVGLSFSYEQYYQAIRRFWRFGQTREVQVHIAMANTEMAIWAAVQRKAADHEIMKTSMFAAMREESLEHKTRHPYRPQLQGTIPSWIERRTA